MPKLKKPSGLIGTLVALIITFAFLMLLYRAGIPVRSLASMGSIAGLSSFLPAIVSVIAIHEIGHLVMGLLVGLRFSSITIWPISVAKEGDRLRARLSFTKQNATYMIASDFDDYAYRTAIFAAGGFFANLVYFAIAYLLMLRQADAGHAETFFTSYLDWLAYFSLLIGTSNLLVFRNRPLPTDGATFFDAVRNAPEFRRSIAVQQLEISMRNGVRARDLDRAIIAEAVALRDGSRAEMSANIIAYSVFSSTENDAAVFYLERALAATRHAGAGDRQALAVEASIYAATRRKDISLARHWLQGISLAKALPVRRLRVEAALAYAEGKRDLAIAKVEELIADPSIANLPTRVILEAGCRSWIEEMRNEP